jgi:predicted methyltransferase
VHNVVKQLKKVNKDLKEAEVEGILYFLKTSDVLTNNELIKLTGLPKETLRGFKKSFGTYLSDSSSEDIRLNDTGKGLLRDLDLRPYTWSLVEYADSVLEKKLAEVRMKYSLVPVREYDQWFADIRTSVAKAKILHKKGLVEGKSIALFGDDDLVSVVLALMGVSYNKVSVFDVDKKLLKTIKAITRELGVRNISVCEYDAREDFNARDLGTFDVVLTDPPYTKFGVTLFLNRAIQLLKPHKDYSGSYVLLNYGNSFKSPEKTLKIQEIINDFNLLVEDKINKFARYEGAESVGSTSSLYVLKTTPVTAPKEDLFSNTIYTYENVKEEKFPFVDHYVFKVHEVPTNLLNSKTALLRAVGEFCNKHKLKVVKTGTTKFKPHGYTVTVVLSNSNLLLHTWPEHNAVHIDLVSCTPIYNKKNMVKTLQGLFSTQKIEQKRIE